MSPTTDTKQSPGYGAGSRAACLERLATALSGYPDLDMAVQAEGLAPCLAVRNTAIPFMTETVGITELGDGLVYTWSWGQRIGDASDPGAVAGAIAYVLQARDVGPVAPPPPGPGGLNR